MADTTPSCATCSKTSSETENLKRCAKCQTTWYCSRECQKKDWKAHKKVCSKQAADAPKAEHSSTYKTPQVKNLEVQIDKPFTALEKGTYLHDRSEKDVYKLLIDCFRMRQEDNYKLEGDVDVDSIYAGAGSSIKPFREFLRLATSRRGLLPSW